MHIIYPGREDGELEWGNDKLPAARKYFASHYAPMASSQLEGAQPVIQKWLDSVGLGA